MILGTDVRLESPDPTPFIYTVKLKKQTHSYTSRIENCTHSYNIFQILLIHILFGWKRYPIDILFMWKWYPFIYSEAWKVYLFQPHICIQWWFVNPDTFVPSWYFRINKFSGLLNRPSVQKRKSVPALIVRISEISGLSEPGLTNHHCIPL